MNRVAHRHVEGVLIFIAALGVLVAFAINSGDRPQQEVRRMQMPAVGQGADISHKLDRRRSVAALTESGVGHVKIVPFRLMPQLLDPEFELRPERLVRGFFQLLLDLFDLRLEFPELCLTNGRDAGALVRQIDARPLTEMEKVDPLLELLDPQLEAETVEVAVGRMHNGFVNRRLAEMRQRGHRIVAEHNAAVLNARVFRRDRALAQRGDRGQQLPGRTRREPALNDAVVERLVRVFVQLANLFLALRRLGALREDVRIEGRTADHRQYFTVVRVHHRDRPASRRHRVGLRFGGLQNVQVERRVQVAARNRLDAFDLPIGLNAATAVYEHAALAVFARQDVVVFALDAEFADDVAEFVSIIFAERTVRLLQFFRADLADVTERVGGQLAVKVKALWRLFGGDHRIFIPMRIDPGDVTFRGQLFDHYRFVLRPVLGVLEALGQPLTVDPQVFGQQIGYPRKFRVFETLAA